MALLINTEATTASRLTLIVGAGINAGRGIPGWVQLVQRAWTRVFGPGSDYRGALAARLELARGAVRNVCGWNESELAQLSLPIHSLELQFALELIDLELMNDSNAAEKVRHLVASSSVVPFRITGSRDLLPALLTWCLYEHRAEASGRDTLSEVARFVRRSRRLVRVISLNVDNLLELEVQKAEKGRTAVASRWLDVISRARHRPSDAIPVYHVHGFLPLGSAEAAGRRKDRRVKGAKTSQILEHATEPVPEGVVFTDLQYWHSVETPLSFANFVFSNALHDSSCLFLGLSMTDINIMRWLGLHTAEFRREYERERVRQVDRSDPVPHPYARHCWIRTDSSDPSGLITRILAVRGVPSESLPSWEPRHLRKVFDALLMER